jgi:hypothetical protein
MDRLLPVRPEGQHILRVAEHKFNDRYSVITSMAHPLQRVRAAPAIAIRKLLPHTLPRRDGDLMSKGKITNVQ